MSLFTIAWRALLKCGVLPSSRALGADSQRTWTDRFKAAAAMIGRNLTSYSVRYGVSEAEMLENVSLEQCRDRAGHSPLSRMFLRYSNNNTYAASYRQLMKARHAIAEAMHGFATAAVSGNNE
jgi:hypothetical protein